MQAASRAKTLITITTEQRARSRRLCRERQNSRLTLKRLVAERRRVDVREAAELLELVRYCARRQRRCNVDAARGSGEPTLVGRRRSLRALAARRRKFAAGYVRVAIYERLLRVRSGGALLIASSSPLTARERNTRKQKRNDRADATNRINGIFAEDHNRVRLQLLHSPTEPSRA